MIEIVKLGDGRLAIYRAEQVNSGLVYARHEIEELGDGRLAIYRAEQVNSGLVLARHEIEELQNALSEVLQWQED